MNPFDIIATLALSAVAGATVLTVLASRQQHRIRAVQADELVRLHELTRLLRRTSASEPVVATLVSSDIDIITGALRKIMADPAAFKADDHQPGRDTRPSGNDSERIVKEINHSLSTPLAQIALVLNLIQAGNCPEPVRDRIRTAEQSIELSRAVLAAYRELTSLVSTAETWDIEDLNRSVESLASLLQDSNPHDQKISCSIQLPTRLNGGISNYFVLALLLPLIQNAIESAPPGSVVRCNAHESGQGSMRIIVSNSVSQPVDVMKIREAGFSTKGSAHVGMGLASVETLLSRVPGSELTFDTSAVEFKVTLAFNDLAARADRVGQMQ